MGAEKMNPPESRSSHRSLRFLSGCLTRKERAILGLLAAALAWGAAGGTLEFVRGRRSASGEHPDLYRRLAAALPDPDFSPVRREEGTGEAAAPRRAVYLTRPLFDYEPEVEVSEEGWIFFPRDYHTTININRAGFDELVSLPGIGPVTAWRIIRYRRRYVGFSRMKALTRVKGIGEKTLKRLEGKIRLY